MKTHIDWLELTNNSANPTDTDSTRRGIVAVGKSVRHWNGTSWLPLELKAVTRTGATITTTGAVSEYIIAPEAGSLISVEINPLVALATSDSNYITWTITNLGQDGAGTTAMLAAVDANTTKATGGIALAANTKRSLTVHGTATNLVVTQGDKIQITATVTGTLVNTVTVPVYQLRFGGV